MKVQSRILESWKKKLVEVIFKGEDYFYVMILDDFDDNGAYLKTSDFENTADTSYYFWRKIKIIRLSDEI